MPYIIWVLTLEINVIIVSIEIQSSLNNYANKPHINIGDKYLSEQLAHFYVRKLWRLMNTMRPGKKQ